MSLPIVLSSSTARQRVRLIGSATAAIFFWASAYPAIRVGLRLFSPGQLAEVRFLVAGLCLAVVVAVQRPRLPTGAAAVRVAVAGALGIAAYNLLLNTGELRISAGAASFLINCMPVMAALLGVLFLGERFRAAGWLGIALSFVGVSVIAISQPGGMQASLASLLVLAAAGCAALMSLLQKPLLRSFSPVAVTACMMWTGAALLLPYLPGAVRAVAGASAASAAFPFATVVYLGVFPAALAYITWAQVLRQLPLAQAASLLYLIPPVALVVSFLWLGERVGAASLGGGALAIVGVFVLSRSGRRQKEKATPGQPSPVSLKAKPYRGVDPPVAP